MLLSGAVVAFLALEAGILSHDFTLEYVAANSSTTTPFIFLLAGAWAALEGSIVLWGVVLAVFTYLVARTVKTGDRLGLTALAVIGVVSLFWFGLMATVANPFRVCTEVIAGSCAVSSWLPFVAAVAPADGVGANPLLQNHILMAIHPPMLYIGYVGFTAPFAFETARTLDRMGRRVGLVAMLDTLYPLGESLRDRVKRQIETVRAGRWRGVRTVAFWYWSTLRIMGGRLRHGPKWSYLQRKGEPLPADLARKRINHIALRAQYVYRPQLYPGRITYVRAAGDEPQRVQSSPEMWEAVAATLVIRDAPGRHTGGSSMMGESNAAALAAIIAEELSLIDNNV